jgi:adenosine deaminase
MEQDAHMEKIESAKKVELHCHLELAIRQSTLRRLALERGYDVKTDHAFAEAFLIKEPMGQLQSVLHKFLNTRDILDSAELMEQVTFEVCEDMYVHSNVRVLELRYAPSFLLDKHSHMTADALQEAIQRGVARAESTYPMAVGLICILQRTKSVEDNAYWVDFALNHRNGFLALDLADNEVDFDPEPFIPLFNRAKAGGLGITVHAGEPLIPGISKNIRTAIEQMGADRIGHGLQAVEDAKIVELLVQTDTPLELCPTSNWLTGACASIASHPISKLHTAGVKTTVNTDDPGIMCTHLNREFELLMSQTSMDWEALQSCVNWAFDASFIPAEKKQAAWSGIS